ncbi:MAG: YdiU family protein, partial [Burkholderiaceae bacterium]|nr:YdiU family protein [Burkholderiaceae bacterium]
CREAADPYAALLQTAATSTAEMTAQWQAVGFCHGVMNTDNMSILGLTIDYGPFGFLDGFDPHHICNHSDHQGRYAFDRQPAVAFWNLHALAQAMLPLLGNGNGNGNADAASEAALAAVEPYRTTFERAFRQRLAAKFGLRGEREGDLELIDMLMRLLASERTDFTILFRRLADFDSRADADNAALRDMFRDRPAFDAWAARYRERLAHQGGDDDDAARRVRMRRVNPRVVLRNHLAEGAIRLATAGDFSEVARLLRVLEHPFDDPAHPTAQDDADAGFPPDWAQSIEVSCSS